MSVNLKYWTGLLYNLTALDSFTSYCQYNRISGLYYYYYYYIPLLAQHVSSMFSHQQAYLTP
jgi:hypothetical protein